MIDRQKYLNQGGAPTLAEARRHLESGDAMNRALRALAGHPVPEPEPEPEAEPEPTFTRADLHYILTGKRPDPPAAPPPHQPDYGGGQRGRPTETRPGMNELLHAARKGW